MKREIKNPDIERREMLSIQAGRIYWCLAEKTWQTDKLCHQLLLDSENYRDVYYLSSKKNDELPKHIGEQHKTLQTLHVYEIPALAKAYAYLAKDLLRCISIGREMLILIRTTSSIWQRMSHQKLNQCIKSLLDILSMTSISLFIVSEGEFKDDLEQRLLGFQSYLGGLSKTEQRFDRWFYVRHWWYVNKSYQTRRSWVLRGADQGFELLPSEVAKIKGNVGFDDELIFASRQVAEVEGLLTSNWQLVEDNTVLVENSNNIQAATLIFVFNGQHDVYELAKQIYLTRQLCGEWAKIVVRKITPDFRHIDMQILLTCGANLVVPFEIHFSAFLVMLRSLQGHRFQARLPEDIEDFLSCTHLEEHKGEVTLAFFFKQVRRRCLMPIFMQNDKGVLVEMLPKMGISPQQAALSCRIQRAGDIYAYAQDKFLLFLSMCSVADVEKLLSHIFPNTLHHLFIRYHVMSLEKDIIDYLSEHQNLLGLEIDHNLETKILAKQTLTTSSIISPTPISSPLSLGGI